MAEEASPVSLLVAARPFTIRVIKQQFGFTKVRYRGLVKNTAQIVTLALSNLRSISERWSGNCMSHA
jgi:IS5 family transposase